MLNDLLGRQLLLLEHTDLIEVCAAIVAMKSDRALVGILWHSVSTAVNPANPAQSTDRGWRKPTPGKLTLQT
jgi:hypothetical protein